MSNKKCIVLDLDNTLWGGVVGEDGLQGIALSLTPPGNAFIAFQQALLDLYNRGIILAINSRNNPNDAWEVIKTHPNMILKDNHFAAARINWQDKVSNLRELAQELNIGLDSMVFLDDDPTNRALVRSLIPEVETPDLPHDPAQYTRFLNALPYFETTIITDEDKMRGNLYVTERLRKEAEKSYTSPEEFLTGLNLELSMYENDITCLPRLTQLTEKTNQFNTDKKPLNEAEVLAYAQSPAHMIIHARLQDVFGDHGVIAFGLIDLNPSQWHIRSLLMSCRVFGRGVEDALLNYIALRARKAGVKKITIAFTETAKNIPARDFIAKYFKHGSMDVAQAPAIPSWLHLK